MGQPTASALLTECGLDLDKAAVDLLLTLSLNDLSYRMSPGRTGGYPQLNPHFAQALHLGFQEMSRRSHRSLTLEHLLLGLVQVKGGLATDLLQEMVPSLAPIHEALEARLTSFPSEPAAPLSLELKQALAMAMEEARALRHGIIDDTHLLLGILRYEESPAAQILRRHQITASLFSKKLSELEEVEITGSVPLSPPVELALCNARQAAVRYGHATCQAEHLLVSLLNIPDVFMTNNREARDDLVREARALMMSLPQAGGPVENPVFALERLVTKAQEEAFQARSDFVGTDHLFWALIKDESSAVSRLLKAAVKTGGMVRRRLL
jgi:ATP-dependent Clp protease ATP-binding subunit ClpA